jgi:ABC-type transport system involved in cytochrome bd biosynthesis fused ATPase/permease subunit
MMTNHQMSRFLPTIFRQVHVDVDVVVVVVVVAAAAAAVVLMG